MKLPSATFIRFLMVGSLNTAVGFAVYFIANIFLPYTWAYTLAYLTGLIVSYVLNAGWVFKTEMHWKTMLVFPLVYVVQYLVNLFLLKALVEILHIDETVSFFIVVLVTIPLTFVLSKTVFKWLGNPKPENS